MRFMIMVRANKDTEAGVLPSTELLTAMGNYKEELGTAGVMLAGGGSHPSPKARRVTFGNGGVPVTDGPFTETKELIAGFWLGKVKSREEAINRKSTLLNPSHMS